MALKIEAGKFYRTRSGEKAYVGVVGNPMSPEPYQALGWIGDSTTEWCEDGRFFESGEEHKSDLVEEWREPRVFERLLHVYEASDGGFFVTTGRCQNSYWKLIAAKKVVIKEGEGLDDFGLIEDLAAEGEKC